MSDPLTFVLWRWMSPSGYRTVFGPETVYAAKQMIERHYHKPKRIVCVTDRPKELPGIETLPLWEEALAIPPPNGRHNPSCYARLKVFAPDARKMFGERLVSIDLDTVIVNDITPLFERDEDIVMWGESDVKTQWVNGSMFLHRTGTLPQVWTEFDPETSPRKALKAGCFGSDQGWLNYILGGKKIPTWGRQDGIYSYRKHIAVHPINNNLPANARAVFFHGKTKAWDHRCSQIPWIKAHYPRLEAVA